MSKQILFEHPLNERIRLFLRLEHFFSEVNAFGQVDDPLTHQHCLFSLAEILTILGRNEFKTELIKELEKNISHLTQYANLPSVNQDKLQVAIEETRQHLNFMYQQAGKLQKLFPSNELLNNIKQRMGLVTYPCHLDVAGITYWINQPAFMKKQQILSWLKPIKPVEDCIQMILTHIRSSAIFESYKTHEGYFQKNLDISTQNQLIRILIPQSRHCYPEISGGKHRIHVRFLTLSDSDAKQNAISHPIEFHIACCKV